MEVMEAIKIQVMCYLSLMLLMQLQCIACAIERVNREACFDWLCFVIDVAMYGI